MNELIERMQIMFDHHPTKMDLKRKFEERNWRIDESFSNYFYDKTILANKMPIDENELTDYPVDGIPDEITRNQARIQRFGKKKDLLHAFEKIMLRASNKNHTRSNNNAIMNKMEMKHKTKPQTSSQEVAGQNSVPIKCYNCNQTEHVSKNCDKPKRERGSYYECGAIDHRLRDCPQRKKTKAGMKAPQQQLTETASQISSIEE